MKRFTAIHFLLGLVAFALALCHIVVLHRQAPSRSGTELTDSTEVLVVVVVKDLIFIAVIVGLLFIEATKTLVHPDN